MIRNALLYWMYKSHRTRSTLDIKFALIRKVSCLHGPEYGNYKLLPGQWIITNFDGATLIIFLGVNLILTQSG